MQDTSGQNVKVAVVGASGYTGAELLRLLTYHPFVKVTLITSRQYQGKELSEVFPQFLKSKYGNLRFENYDPARVSENDVVFLCLPHGASFPIVKELYYANPKVKIIDFSADFRFKNAETYEKTYKVKHAAKELLKDVAYGLPEINRQEIKSKRIIANPGCYPTSVILGLYPVKKEGLIDESFPVIADCKSGVSGAGRKADLSLTFCEVNDSFKPYAVEGHRHSPEISEKLELPLFKFIPHLVPMNRGILSTVYFRTSATREQLVELYQETYGNETFVRIRKVPPKTSEVVGTNYCDIYVTKDEKTGLGIVISAIDNLIKGASGQAVQNMNVLFGFNEELGLEHFGSVA